VNFLDRETLELIVEHVPNSKDPLNEKCRFYVLIETSGSNSNHDSEKLNKFLEYVMENNLVKNGTVGIDKTQANTLWKIRENAPIAIKHASKILFKYDLSMPISEMYNLVEVARNRLSHKDAYIIGYGHLGDGNLHLNVGLKDERDNQEVEELLEPYVYEWTAKRKGSISAEHGLGVMKANYIHFSKNKEMIAVMRQFKNLLDPKGILNPYKVFPK